MKTKQIILPILASLVLVVFGYILFRNNNWTNSAPIFDSDSMATLKSGGQIYEKSNFTKTGFTWKDSKGYEYPVYIAHTGSCFVIKTSKSGEEYRAYLGEEASEQINKELSNRKSNDVVAKDTIDSFLKGTIVTKNVNSISLFNEITLSDIIPYFVDADFDGEVEKVERCDNGDVKVFKKDRFGNYSQDVSHNIPFCWLKINLCCPAHKAYSTINYTFQTIYVEAHYGCSEEEIRQYKKVNNLWSEIMPVKPFSIINKNLFPESKLVPSYSYRTNWITF